MSPMQQLRARWATLAEREKTMLLLAAAVVGLALFWWVGVAPALATLRAAPAQHRDLDRQLQQMRALQAQAQALQSQPQQGHDEALRALELTIRQRLGSTARYTIAGDRVTVTLTAAPPEALAQWLTQARVNARALPTEARLTRNAAGLWDGSLVLSLPAR
ncbi:MAG: type II secretion system protein GspM [Ramlibacter sp.]|nr:type II secretion system protein M [Ramlibacter sp.]